MLLSLPLVLGCSGGEDPGREPLPGEARLLDAVHWDGPPVPTSLAVLDGDTAPALVVGTRNASPIDTGEAAVPGFHDAPVGLVLRAPFSGGPLSGAASAQVWRDESARTLASADWTGDAIDDLAVAGEIHAGPFAGDVTSASVASWEFTSGPIGYNYPDSVHGCDVDQDGVQDLCTNWGILLGPLFGAYTQHELTVTVAAPLNNDDVLLPYGEVAHVADLTGDGREGLLIAARYDAGGHIHLLRDPISAPHWNLETDADVVWTGTSIHEPDELDAADLDADGVDNLIVGGGSVTWVLTDTAGGPLTDAPITLEGLGSAVAAGDFDGDGATDLAASLVSSSTGQVGIWLGPLSPGVYDRLDTAAIWKAEKAEDDSFGRPMLAADLDLDGRDDLVAGAVHWDSPADDGAIHRSEGRLWLLWGGNL